MKRQRSSDCMLFTNADSKDAWNELPTEILLKLVHHVNCFNTSQTQWMYVNKQWLNVFYSLTFNEITFTSLYSSQCVTLHKLFNSVFKPGRHVKTVKFAELCAPIVDINTYDPTSDPLLRLMVSCPNVEKVEFLGNSINAKAWSYFVSVFNSNSAWNSLQFLPSYPGDDNLLYSYYYCCASKLKGSLKKLQLHKGVMGNHQLHLLQEYKQLEELIVGYGILSNFNDCYQLLQHAPLLRYLQIDFLIKPFATYSFREAESFFNHNLSTLVIANYIPSKQDLISISQSFAKLNELHLLVTHSKHQWPSSLFGSKAMNTFIKTITTYIPTFNISIQVENEILALDGILQGIDDSAKGIILRMGFKKANGDVGDVSLQLTQQKYEGIMVSVSFTHTTNIKALETRCITFLNQVFKCAKIKGLIIGLANSAIIKAIFDFQRCSITSISTIVLVRAEIRDLTPTIDLTEQASNNQLSSLSLRTSVIFTPALHSLSYSIQSLETLEFIDCRFFIRAGQSAGNNIDISMPFMTVDHLSWAGSGSQKNTWIVDYSLADFTQTIVLLVVKSRQQHVARYYISTYNKERTSFFELTHSTFNILKQNRNQAETMVIKLEFKSIRTVSFKLPAENSTGRIKLNIT